MQHQTYGEGILVSPIYGNCGHTFVLQLSQNLTFRFSVGRLDDMITLSTGEKVIPMPMENILLEDHRIQGALAFGQQHHQIGMLIEPSGEPKDTELFINEIWHVVVDSHPRC